LLSPQFYSLTEFKLKLLISHWSSLSICWSTYLEQSSWNYSGN